MLKSINVRNFFRCLLLVSATLLSACAAKFDKQVFSEGPVLGEGREWRQYPVATDFDKDGWTDIIATHRRPLMKNSLHIWRGQPDGSFVSAKQQWTSPGYSALAIGDINHDNKEDIVAASHFNRVHTFVQRESLSFEEEFMQTPDGYVRAELVDLDGDSKLELVLLGNERAGIEIMKRNKAGNWELKETLKKGFIGRDLQVIDVTEDGRLDIVVSLARGGNVVILEQGADGSWNETVLDEFYSATNEFRSFKMADINGDGRKDFALNGGFAGVAEDNGPDVYLASEDGSWKAAGKGLKAWKNPTPGIAVADFTGDGHLDIVAGGNMTGGLSDKSYGLFLFVGDGGKSWVLAENSGLSGVGLARPHAITVSDLNYDGLQDLAVTHGAPEEGTGYLTVWYGKAQPEKAS